MYFIFYSVPLYIPLNQVQIILIDTAMIISSILYKQHNSSVTLAPIIIIIQDAIKIWFYGK